MAWKYEPMSTRFERVVFGTFLGSMVLPAMVCLLAEGWAKGIVLWIGVLYQAAALVLAAHELNQLDVRTFKGPGFLRRMGWKPNAPVVVQLSGLSASVSASTGDISIASQDNSVDARLKRLEAEVESLRGADKKLREALERETKSRTDADQALKAELRTELGNVDARLKEAALGELEWVYAALILGGMGTLLSTFNEAIGAWFQ
jgi:hypothetical protein